MSEEEYSKYHENALETKTGTLAKEAGITYLEEGFTLSTVVLSLQFTPRHTHLDPVAGPRLGYCNKRN
jgi:hypothetical protein